MGERSNKGKIFRSTSAGKENWLDTVRKVIKMRSGGWVYNKA